jgi:hypothetical protein
MASQSTHSPIGGSSVTSRPLAVASADASCVVTLPPVHRIELDDVLTRTLDGSDVLDRALIHEPDSPCYCSAPKAPVGGPHRLPLTAPTVFP